MNISQIRAYSYTANAYQNYQYLTSSIWGCAETTNLIYFPGHVTTNVCAMPLNGNNPAYYNIVFDVTRFVHGVTLVGTVYLDFDES